MLQKKIPFEVLTETDEPTEETGRCLSGQRLRVRDYSDDVQNLIIHKI